MPACSKPMSTLIQAKYGSASKQNLYSPEWGLNPRHIPSAHLKGTQLV